VLPALGVLLADSKSDVLFIDPNGYVGINQTKPESPLDVNGRAQLRGNTMIGGDLNLGNSSLQFTNTEHKWSELVQVGRATIENTKDLNSLLIAGRTTGTDAGRIVTVWDRVGIGKANPNVSLNVERPRYF
jgi:hypothetical protein